MKGANKYETRLHNRLNNAIWKKEMTLNTGHQPKTITFVNPTQNKHFGLHHYTRRAKWKQHQNLIYAFFLFLFPFYK